MKSRRLINGFLGILVLLTSTLSGSSFAQYDFLIFDSDNNFNSGPIINNTLRSIGFTGDYTTTLAPYVGSLEDYCSIWICLGVFPNASYPWFEHPDWNDSLVSYLLNHDGNIYMEGGDCWFNDPPFSLRGYFNIDGYDPGTFFLFPLMGVTGTFTEGMFFGYGGDSADIDCIRPLASAFAIFTDSARVCTCGVANEPGTYKTLGLSFEFGGFVDGPSKKVDLAESIMSFFDCRSWRPDYDVAVIEIVRPDWYALPGIPTAPQIRFKNLGLNDADSVDAYVVINPGAYNSHRIISVDSGGELIQDFDPWTPGRAGERYMICCYHTWALDERPGNDTLCGNVTSWDGRWHIGCPWTMSGGAVIADGYIDVSSEWADAIVRDVADLLGRVGTPEPPGSAYLYAMNDSLNLYLALDAVVDPSRTDQDLWSMYFEDNFDRSWPNWPDSSEGETRIGAYVLTGHYYEPLFSDYSVDGYWVDLNARCGDSSGHMQYEYVIPCGDDPARGDSIHPNLLAGPGDTVGFWMMALDMGAAEVYAWWPTSSFLEGWDNSQQGMLILSDGIVGEAEVDCREVIGGLLVSQNFPNPFRDRTAIRLNMPESMHISLTVYGVAGRAVATLIDEELPTGIHTVEWNTDAPSGVYFYRLKAGDFTDTKKMLLLRPPTSR